MKLYISTQFFQHLLHHWLVINANFLPVEWTKPLLLSDENTIFIIFHVTICILEHYFNFLMNLCINTW